MPEQENERKDGEPEAVAATEVRDRLTELMNRAAYGNERIVLTVHAKPLVALVSMRDLERLTDLDKAAA